MCCETGLAGYRESHTFHSISPSFSGGHRGVGKGAPDCNRFATGKKRYRELLRGPRSIIKRRDLADDNGFCTAW